MDPNAFHTFPEAPLNRMKRRETPVTTSRVLVERVGEVRNLRRDGQKFQQQQQQGLLMDNFMRRTG